MVSGLTPDTSALSTWVRSLGQETKTSPGLSKACHRIFTASRIIMKLVKTSYRSFFLAQRTANPAIQQTAVIPDNLHRQVTFLLQLTIIDHELHVLLVA
jgi:hypothetical protein